MSPVEKHALQVQDLQNTSPEKLSQCWSRNRQVLLGESYCNQHSDHCKLCAAWVCKPARHVGYWMPAFDIKT
jgi:hypothetical protein